MAFIAALYAGATVTTAMFVGSIVGQFLISTVLGAALRALSPKPSVLGSNRGYQTNQMGPAQDHSVIYGEVKVGGAIVYDEATGTNNKFLHRIIAVAGHEVDSFVDFYINDELAEIDSNGNVTSPASYSKTSTTTVRGAQTGVDADGRPIYGPDVTSTTVKRFVRISTHTGSPDQAADEGLVSESSLWNNQCTLSGIAYIYVRLTFSSDVFPNGVPTITATVRGKKVYDPRTDTTAYSNNPALCMRDYLTSGKGSDDTTPYSYGLGEVVVNVDDALVTASANVCDQTNTDAGTTRYTTNGSFTTSATPYDTITAMLTAMGGSMWYAQGAWRMKAAYWTAPVMDLNEDDLRSGISVGTRHSRRDNFNTIKGTFRGLESDWQVTDYPEVTNSGFVTTDGGQVSVADVDLPFTDTSVTSRRLGLISLERNRQQLTVNASFGLRALELQVGDNVRITNTRFGWTNKEFEVIQWAFGLVDGLDLQVEMTLRETAESVFDEVSDGITYERDNTILMSPFDVPAVSISVSPLVQVSNQKVSNIAIATITSSRPEFIDYVEVEYKLSSESSYSSFGQGTLGEFRVRDLEVNFYDFRARAINTFGIKGEFEYLVDVEVNAFAGDPSDVVSLTVELSGGTMFVSWPPLPDADLSHYELKLNTNTTGATWGNSSTVVEKIARPATSTSLPARSGTLLIKAYDKEGNFSVNVATAVVLPSDLPQLGVTDSQTEDPAFAGDKSGNTTIVSSTLQIDNTTAVSPTGDYLFSNYIDTGTTRSARVTGFRTFTRAYDNGTLLWDDIPQNWDTWPDNWDTWTDEDANFGDVSVTTFVSATDDDPAGTPTWGAYSLANGNFIQGRAFRFKAVLSSVNTKFTPALTELSVKVEY